MSEELKNKYRLLSDEPILESTRTDRLKFKHTAQVLARAALFTESPITIGVFGSWGSGKTSLMRLMQQIVDDEGTGGAVPVWFNAWQYEREEHLIIPLIATIAREIKKKESNLKGPMKEGGKKVHDALRSIIYGLSMKGKLGVPGLGDLEISASMKDVIERYEAVTQDTLMARSLYFDAFDQLREVSRNETDRKPQIVVFVDDLDRCFPEQAVRLLESIKLVLHQPRFAFVLGIYPQIVEEFIRNKYAAQYPLAAARVGSGDEKEVRRRMETYLGYFKDYLGKIVQVRHQVPERSPDQMQDYIRHLLENVEVKEEFLGEGDEIAEEDLLELIAEVGRRSPREIVRKINDLIVKWRIATAEGTDGYDLLAGLINEIFSERIARGERDCNQFLHRLEWPMGEKDSTQTYGSSLADGLEKAEKEAYHPDNISRLKKQLKAEESPTMNSLIDLLAKDEHLYKILNTNPGRRWLQKKQYREEIRAADAPGTDVEEMFESAGKRRSQPYFPEGAVVPEFEGLEAFLPGLKLVNVSGGEFEMGSNDDDAFENERPVHEVTLTDFRISATPVTQAQYEAVMGENPSGFKGEKYPDAADLPVENVSWNDAMVFCERATQLAKKYCEGQFRFTLPTEAQWEYAARGGNQSKGYKYSGSNELDEVGWFDENSGAQIQPVGRKKSNELGLYDMSGNVWEWCKDRYGKYKNDPQEDPHGPEQGSNRVLRGGSWNINARYCRCAARYRNGPDLRINLIGFRVVLAPVQASSQEPAKPELER